MSVVLFEGVDGSGKSTVIQNIYNLWLNSGFNQSHLFFEPSNSKLGQLARSYHDTFPSYTKTLLYLADRSQVWSKIKEIINKDYENLYLKYTSNQDELTGIYGNFEEYQKTIPEKEQPYFFVDRSSPSTIVYNEWNNDLFSEMTSTEFNHLEDLHLILKLDRQARYNLDFDLVFYFQVDDKTAYDRITKRNSDYSSPESISLISKRYEALFNHKMLCKALGIKKVVRIDANQSIDNVVNQVMVSLFHHLT